MKLDELELHDLRQPHPLNASRATRARAVRENRFVNMMVLLLGLGLPWTVPGLGIIPARPIQQVRLTAGLPQRRCTLGWTCVRANKSLEGKFTSMGGMCAVVTVPRPLRLCEAGQNLRTVPITRMRGV